MSIKIYTNVTWGLRERLKTPRADSEADFLVYEKIDLTGIASLELGFLKQDNLLSGTEVEVRSGSEKGKLLGKALLASYVFKVPIEAKKGVQDLVLVFKNEQKKGQGIGRLDWLGFEKRKL